MKSYEDDDDDDFEFPCVYEDPTSVDKIFYNSQIRPVFLIFGKVLLFFDVENCKGEFDGVLGGTYCVWKSKSDASIVAKSSERYKKSSSTGSSKRWKFRDHLYRSNSDGKDTFIFLAPSNANSKNNNNKKASERATEVKVVGRVKPMVAGGGVMVAQERDRRRLLMSYRQDLVGFFANVNLLSRNLKEMLSIIW
ncbi:hypothetical protein ACSBR2_011800 [Camellia fascicularis]